MMGLAGCIKKQQTSAVALPAPPAPHSFSIAPIRARMDRVFRITVCTRPFRPAGPRFDVERVGDKTVLHNYGHGGSGWSLSWGSAAVVTERAMAQLGAEREVAVVGCGALGLTAAITLQQAGAKVTIYAKDRPADTRSARATGTWSPDSRIAHANAVSPDFPALWEKMCRRSFKVYESYLGLPGNPVEWNDRYQLSDRRPGDPPTPRPPASRPAVEVPEFAHYMDRIQDITPGGEALAPGMHPFPTPTVSRTTGLMFNVAGYSRQLVHDFLTEGGRIEHAEFQTPGDFARIPQRVIVNSTGYGARALFKDETMVPVRGQITWLVPQADVNYGLIYKGIMVLARRDGIVVQSGGVTEADGYNNDNETPDRSEAESSVKIIADLFSRF